MSKQSEIVEYGTNQNLVIGLFQSDPEGFFIETHTGPWSTIFALSKERAERLRRALDEWLEVVKDWEECDK